MVVLEKPDSGRAWVVAVAACLINTILSGLSRMVGILYVAVIEYYGVTREQAFLPFITRNAVRGLSGPLVGILGERYGIRAVTFWGGVLASLGAVLCAFAPSVTWLCVLWGGLHGLGFALANTLFQVVLNQYFHKFRATASGLALSGACIGSLVFPILVEEILQTYSLNGSFLILGGIVMQVLPAALLIKSPQWVEYPEAYARLYALEKLKEVNSEESGSCSQALVPEDHHGEAECRKMARTTSLSNCPIESVDVYRASRRSRQREREMAVFRGGRPKGRAHSLGPEVRCTTYMRRGSPVDRHLSHSFEPNYTAYTSTVTEFYNSMSDHSIEEPFELESRRVEFSSAPASQTPAETNTVWQSIVKIGNLYLNPMYVLISLSMSSYVFIYIPTLTVLVDYSMDKGISAENGKYLIVSMAVGDFIGRICFGWVTDRHVLTVPRFLMLVLVLQGLSVILLPLTASLYPLITVLILYSVMAGCLIVIFPVLVHEYVETDNQSLGMACIGLMSGLFSFGTSPIIGYFRDNVGSYDGMFFIAGGISVFCGILWNFEPLIKKYLGK